MMTDAEIVYNRYWGVLPNANPIFKEVIQGLIDAKLYTSALSSPASLALPSIMEYTNGSDIPKSAVALDVIVDVITRTILKSLQSGYSDVLAPTIKYDAGSNISFASTVPIISVNLSTCDNVTQAINLLGQEIQALKIQLQATTAGAFQSTALLPAASAQNLVGKINIK
jgi:hypothetical protein